MMFRLSLLFAFIILTASAADEAATAIRTLVNAAPLIVGAVCRNGVALVAVRSDKNWIDQHRGPTRIQLIGGDGMALLTAGWRTDASYLAKACRDLAANELESFGSTQENILVHDAALFMANTPRPLAVVGLFGSSQSLHLVDTTGAHEVRAYAVGKGAKHINAKLRAVVDFENMTAREGLNVLCKLLTESKEDDDSDKKDNDWEPLPKETPAELAIVDSDEKTLVRTRQPFLIAAASTSSS